MFAWVFCSQFFLIYTSRVTLSCTVAECASKYPQYANYFNLSRFKAYIAYKALKKQGRGMLRTSHDDTDF